MKAHRTMLATALGAVLAQAAVADPVTLRFASGAPSVSDIWSTYLGPWADRVNEAAGDSLKIESFPDGALGANGQTFDRVDAGVAEIGWDIPLVYGQRFASLTVVGLPFTFDDAEDACAAMWRLHERDMFPELDAYKVIAFVCNPNVNIFLTDPLEDPTDLAGNKIALGSKLRGQIVSEANGVPVSVAVPEYYQSLSRGVVSGVMTNVQVLEAWKLGELVTYFLDVPFGGAVSVLFMRKDAYEALPPEAKAAIDANSGEEESRRAARSAIASEARTLEILLQNPEANYIKAEGEVRAEWQAALAPLSTDWEQETPNGTALLAAFKEEMAK